jgi:hypothetical protein
MTSSGANIRVHWLIRCFSRSALIEWHHRIRYDDLFAPAGLGLPCFGPTFRKQGETNSLLEFLWCNSVIRNSTFGLSLCLFYDTLFFNYLSVRYSVCMKSCQYYLNTRIFRIFRNSFSKKLVWFTQYLLFFTQQRSQLYLVNFRVKIFLRQGCQVIFMCQGLYIDACAVVSQCTYLAYCWWIWR